MIQEEIAILPTKEYSVSGISQLIKTNLETNFNAIRVKGEISGLKIAPSGHIYFSLKDSAAVLSAICWRGVAAKLVIKLTEGMEVVCLGSITSYPMQGKYQLIATSIEVSGSGALMEMLLKKKEQFLREGLFAQERKKKIPFLPKKIGIVTSFTGAVIRDILHRLNDRMPMHVLVWGTLVQGEQAAAQIAAAINGFNEMLDKVDVIIVARGGGSIEDLWAFNEEIVIRATANSNIPLISAVGHETDITLIDYASDLRAPTPTAAAEMAVPVRSHLLLALAEQGKRLESITINYINFKESYLKALASGLPKANNLLTDKLQRLDNISMRFISVMRNFLTRKQHALALAKIKHPGQIILYYQRNLNNLSAWQNKAIHQMLNTKELKLSHLDALLASCDYKKILNRGFAIMKSKTQIITSIKQIQESTPYAIELSDGALDVIKV
jgi:exodeoxyribonuclease VII large subunit